MRALFFIADSAWSSSARVFAAAAHGLVARGHDALVVCQSGCPTQRHLSGAGVEVVTVRSESSGASEAFQLRGVLRERRPEAVFVHAESEALIVASALTLSRVQAAVVRRVPPFAAISRGAAGRFAARVAATQLLFSTDADRRAAEGDASRSALAPIGVDAASYDGVAATTRSSHGIPATARLIVCVQDGSTHGARIALRTLAQLTPRHSDLHIAFIGCGAMDNLRMQGAALGVNRQVSYLGDRDDAMAIMKAAHVGWVAAQGDTGAYALLDFMALGVPVVALRTPLTEFYVANGSGGALLDAGDESFITAAATAAFLGQSANRDAMGQAARARVEREFSIEPMIAGFERALAGGADRQARRAS
jgi:glycosyltransferase involved in cell wall biosynthesis